MGFFDVLAPLAKGVGSLLSSEVGQSAAQIGVQYLARELESGRGQPAPVPLARPGVVGGNGALRGQPFFVTQQAMAAGTGGGGGATGAIPPGLRTECSTVEGRSGKYRWRGPSRGHWVRCSRRINPANTRAAGRAARRLCTVSKHMKRVEKAVRRALPRSSSGTTCAPRRRRRCPR